MRYQIILIALLVTIESSYVWADEPSGGSGATVNGYGRTKVGALLENGNYFLAENTLNLKFQYRTGDAAFYANVALYEREGVVKVPGLRELYIDLKGETMDLRIGKQQVIWGKGEGVFITDIVSPKDLSQFLLPDFEEIRLGVTGVRASLYVGNGTLELVWVPWFTKTLLPGQDSLWAPKLLFPIKPTIQDAELPDFSLNSASYYARYSYLGESFDVSLIGGWYWNDTPFYEIVSKTFTPEFGLTALEIRPKYYRIYSMGFAFASTIGPVVVKSEGAYFGNKRYQGNPIVYPKGYVNKDMIQYLVGADYSIEGITFGIQYIQEIILKHEDDLTADPLKNMLTIALSRSFLRDTIKIELFTYIGLDAKDALIKPKIAWTGIDAVELFMGAYLFVNNTGDFGQYYSLNGLYIGGKMSF